MTIFCQVDGNISEMASLTVWARYARLGVNLKLGLEIELVLSEGL